MVHSCCPELDSAPEIENGGQSGSLDLPLTVLGAPADFGFHLTSPDSQARYASMPVLARDLYAFIEAEVYATPPQSLKPLEVGFKIKINNVDVPPIVLNLKHLD